MSTRVEVADEPAGAKVEAPRRERSRRLPGDEHEPRPNPLREGLAAHATPAGVLLGASAWLVTARR